MQNSFVKISFVTVFLNFLFLYTANSQIQKNVFRLTITDRNDKSVIVQTGFIYKMPSGQIGILTALHGLLNYENKRIIAENEFNEIYDNLKVDFVSINDDAAFLTIPTAHEYFRIATASSSVRTNVKTIGYPLGVISIYERRTIGGDVLSIEKIAPLRENVGSNTLELLLKRGSPSINKDVLIIVGSIRKGESGSPIFNSNNEAIGMIDGGKENINWAINLSNINLINVLSIKSSLNRIQNDNTLKDLFSETLAIIEMQPNPVASEGIEIFVDTDYKGNKTKLYNDWSATNENDPWFNSISSIKIPKGTKIIVYNGLNFTGSSMALSDNWDAEIYTNPWNDKINSIKFLEIEKTSPEIKPSIEPIKTSSERKTIIKDGYKAFDHCDACISGCSNPAKKTYTISPDSGYKIDISSISGSCNYNKNGCDKNCTYIQFDSKSPNEIKFTVSAGVYAGIGVNCNNDCKIVFDEYK